MRSLMPGQFCKSYSTCYVFVYVTKTRLQCLSDGGSIYMSIIQILIIVISATAI